jgi:hypothetical protein
MKRVLLKSPPDARLMAKVTGSLDDRIAATPQLQDRSSRPSSTSV